MKTPQSIPIAIGIDSAKKMLNKSIINKFILPLVLVLSTTALAQEKKSKVCIKIDEDKNGVVTKIDTCYESSDPKEVEAFLKRMGVESESTITTNSNGSGQTKTIVIKNEEDKDGKKSSYNYTFSNDEKGDNVMVFVDDKGNVTTTSGDAKVIVKEFKGDEKEMEKEIESLIKQAEAEAKSGDGNKKKEVHVFISKKVEINNVSEEDKKKLPSNLQQIKGSAFESLNLYPNPAKDNVTVNYKGNNSDPLTIKLYDAQGKTILVEKEISTDKEMTKKLDLSSLKKGIYFLHLEQGKKSEVKKLVVSE
ncbi:MAG: T9SS type A sorting domain-containing protein [Bacteroidota bacterium]|nr:T9SS type A sorting domain-containing protein [Bacteroidota bacterium]